MSHVELRPAEPNASDGAHYARFLDQAADGLMRTMLGRRSNEIVAASFLHSSHDYSFEHATFAEIDGTPVGMAAAFSGQAKKTHTLGPLQAAAGWRWARFLIVAGLGAPVLGFTDEVPDTDFYLMALAVDPDARGNGIGSILLADVDERARAANCTRVALDVDNDNSDARRLYERQGMTVEKSSPRLPLIGTQVHRMVRDISAR